MDGLKTDLTSFDEYGTIRASIEKAWVAIYTKSKDADFLLTGFLGGKCNSTFNFLHFRNGDFFFYSGAPYPLNGECYLVQKDGRVFNLVFKNGALLCLEKMHEGCRIGNFKIPQFDEIDGSKTKISSKTCVCYSKEGKRLFKISSEDGNLAIEIKGNGENTYIRSCPDDYQLGIDFDNDDNHLAIDGVHYYFDGTLGLFRPANGFEGERKTGCPIMVNPLLEDVSIDDLSRLESYIDALKN